MASEDARDPSRPVLSVRGPRASSVIVHKLAAADGDAFLAWLHGITAVAQRFEGYQSTEVYPPGGGHDEEWVVIIHFDDEATLGAWLAAPQRADWVARLPHAARQFRIRTLPAGFGSWVAGQTGADDALPPVPHWKSFLLVLLALYPVVMVLTLLVSPRTAGLGLPLAMLLGNVLSVAILEWAVMPLLNRLLAPWLRAHGADGRLVSLGGAALIVAVLLAMALAFRLAGA